MTKEEFTKDLKDLIQVTEEYERKFIFYMKKYYQNEILGPEIIELKKDEEVKSLIDKLEKTYLRVQKSI